MPDPLYNATCEITRAASAASGTDLTRRDHSERPPERHRCSFRQLSVQQTQSIFGLHQVEAFACRVIAPNRIPTASTIKVIEDGSDEWLEYRVATSRKDFGRYWNLLLTRV